MLPFPASIKETLGQNEQKTQWLNLHHNELQAYRGRAEKSEAKTSTS